jgi:hypothetical protein
MLPLSIYMWTNPSTLQVAVAFGWDHNATRVLFEILWHLMMKEAEPKSSNTLPQLLVSVTVLERPKKICLELKGAKVLTWMDIHALWGCIYTRWWQCLQPRRPLFSYENCNWRHIRYALFISYHICTSSCHACAPCPIVSLIRVARF